MELNKRNASIAELLAADAELFEELEGKSGGIKTEAEPAVAPAVPDDKPTDAILSEEDVKKAIEEPNLTDAELNAEEEVKVCPHCGAPLTGDEKKEEVIEANEEEKACDIDEVAKEGDVPDTFHAYFSPRRRSSVLDERIEAPVKDFDTGMSQSDIVDSDGVLPKTNNRRELKKIIQGCLDRIADICESEGNTRVARMIDVVTNSIN